MTCLDPSCKLGKCGLKVICSARKFTFTTGWDFFKSWWSIPSSAAADDSEAEEWGLELDSKMSSGKLNSVSSFGKGRLSRSS